MSMLSQEERKQFFNRENCWTYKRKKKLFSHFTFKLHPILRNKIVSLRIFVTSYEALEIEEFLSFFQVTIFMIKSNYGLKEIFSVFGSMILLKIIKTLCPNIQ